MKWVTRERAKVDRIACPWLISRFVDSSPEFLFVPKDRVMETARSENAIPFDIEGAELGHRVEGGEERVSFDAFIRKYRLNDKALLDLAEIVRTADAKVLSRSRPEAAGLKAVATGFRLNAKDDHDNMRLQFPVYDALYAYCEQRVREEAEQGR